MKKDNIENICCSKCNKPLVESGVYITKNIGFFVELGDKDELEYKIKLIDGKHHWHCLNCGHYLPAQWVEDEERMRQILKYRKDNGIKYVIDDDSKTINEMIENDKERQLGFHFLLQNK